jgi:two-component system, NtrC family, sensor kinase
MIPHMTVSEKILVVESDPDVSDLIARQTLKPLGYQVVVAGDASSAIQQAIQFSPDLIIANLHLSGLSGKDLLVALTSQGLNVPVLVMAEKGHEQDVIQSFRLGANDYLILPVRDAEVVSAVERLIKQVRERRARAELDKKIQAANAELEKRVAELMTIISVGRAVVSVTDQRVVLEKILDAALKVSASEIGWLMLRDDKTKTFLLGSQRNLPDAWAKKIGQPLDDGITTLVAMSGETLSINGAPLKKFKVAALGQSAMVVPVKVQKDVIGLLAVLRKADLPFEKSQQTLVEAIVDYASISLVNSQLFRSLAQTVEAAQAGEKRKNDLLQNMRQEIQATLQPAIYPVDLMLSGQMGALTDEQKQALTSVQTAQRRLLSIANQQATQPRL